MQTIDRVSELRSTISRLRESGGRIALVPTMGALHQGHLTLVEKAQRCAEHVVVSIFVNPAQFGPNEDFSAYPRRMAEDTAKLEAAGVTILWAPTVEEMYPHGFATTVSVAGITDHLEGPARPGHFDGVATVVAKLFTQVAPDVALFGEKDWQQLAVVRRMASDLDLPLAVVGVPTVREADGLALSSRNAYLSPEERRAATALPAAMQVAADAITNGEDIKNALSTLRAALTAAGFGPIDYAAYCDPATMEPLADATRDGRLLVAAKLGKTRLIDNIPVPPKR